MGWPATPPALVEPVAAFVADWFAGRGIETFRQPVFPGRDNVVAVLPGRDRTRRVVLEAHMDTVTTSGMTIPPFDPVVRDGNLYGRGACDTKGGLAGMMCALDEVARAGTPPPCDVWLAAVVAEPTDLRIVTATKGVLRFRIEVRGKASHTAKPHLGVNAISGARRGGAGGGGGRRAGPRLLPRVHQPLRLNPAGKSRGSRDGHSPRRTGLPSSL